MRPEDEGGPRREGRLEGLAAKQDAQRHHTPTLRPGVYGAYGADDLRLVLNTLSRERPHWWLRTADGRSQRELLEALGWWAA
jgi:hypothetical protein